MPLSGTGGSQVCVASPPEIITTYLTKHTLMGQEWRVKTTLRCELGKYYSANLWNPGRGGGADWLCNKLKKPLQ